jgi:hypothetical protein
VLEIGESSIDPHVLADMIESRWRVIACDSTVARLQNVRFELCPVDEEGDNIIRKPTKFDAETLTRLRNYHQEGMDISIIDVEHGYKDLLKIHPT